MSFKFELLSGATVNQRRRKTMTASDQAPGTPGPRTPGGCPRSTSATERPRWPTTPWTRQFADWARDLPKPKAVLMVSAHWEAAPLALGATSTVPLTYDFWGFPDKYYTVRYPAPGAPELASDVRKLLRAAEHPRRGHPGPGP